MFFAKVQLSLIFGLIAFVIGDFQCPPKKGNCTCARGGNGDFQLFCPKRHGSPEVMVQVLPRKYVQIHCFNPVSTEKDLELIKDLDIGPVHTFSLNFCALPKDSFKDLMETANISNVGILQVQSHSDAKTPQDITRAHLKGLSHLTQINFASNGLAEVPEDLFQDTTNLTWLDMKDNRLVPPKGLFRSLSKIEVLELGSNNMSYLEPGIFRNLTKLRLLNLWSNRLQNLSRSLFSDLVNLENLDLSSNGLITLPPDLFNDLSRLKVLNLNANNFFSLPQGLFLGTTNIEKIQIQFNRRTLRPLPSGFFSNLNNLQEVFLNECNLTQVPEDLFWGSSRIIDLQLQKNLLSTLPPNLLKDATLLQRIDLSYNRITSIPDELFKAQDKLTTLNLSFNQIQNITDKTFTELIALQTLYLGNNRIQFISPQAFQGTVQLTTINLSNNKIAVFATDFYDELSGRKSFLQNCVKLTIINLSNNYIDDIFGDWRLSMSYLESLDLSNNMLTSLTIDDLLFYSNAKLTLDLSYNNISKIGLDNAEILAKAKFVSTEPDRKKDNTVRVVLKGNPLHCDCQAYSLVRFLKGELDTQVEYLLDLDVTNFTCSGPLGYENLMVRALDPKQLTCHINKEREWDPRCTYHFKPASKAFIMNCSHQDLTEFPKFVPLTPEVIEHTNHTFLILKGNRITKFPKMLGPGYERVTELELSDNNLTHVNISLLSRSLKMIALDNNNLTRLDAENIEALNRASNLSYVKLYKNPWICDCKSVHLLSFIHSNFKKVLNYGNITCANGKVFTNLTENALCPTALATDVTIGMSFVAVLGFIICGITILYYKYQKEIKVWMYANGICLWFVTEEELDKDKTYDAFVSYSHQDENFVVDKLVPGLEDNGPIKYKLCLHYRDWIVGDFIPDQIARSVEESRRTIVILSPNFLESVWGRMEFKAAHLKALKDGRARVIVVIYGDLGDTEKLDPELKAYLSMNTYVKWGDPWFWEKIRYAMPHPPSLSRNIPLIMRRSTKQNTPGKLVNGLAEINGITTPPAEIIVDPLKISSKPA